MTTSDSEDFESADEEIEPSPLVFTSKSKSPHASKVIPDEKIKHDPPPCALTSEIPEEQISNESKPADLNFAVRGVSALAIHEKDQNKLGDVNSIKSNESASENIQAKETLHGSDETLEKEKQNLEDSHADTSRIGEADVKVSSEDANQSLTRSQRNRRPQRSKENKTGPMKLGVRVTPSRDIILENQTVDNAEKPSSVETETTEPAGEPRSSLSDRNSEIISKAIEPGNITNKVEQQQQQPAEQSSGWGFGKSLIGSSTWSSVGGWGSSLFNTASLSVSTLGSHVTQGISTVLETVEAGIGAPSPEELAIKLKEEEEKKKIEGKDGTSATGDPGAEEGELEMDEAWGDWKDDDLGEGEGGKTGTGLFSLVSGVTQVTGKVLSTGLDTLETIGKKTMEVLQEGLVHLEALEMLSRQSDLRLKSLLLKETGPALRALQIRLAAVQEMCEIPEHDEEEESSVSLTETLPEALKSLKVDISAEKVIKSCKDSFGKLEDMKKESEGNNESKITTRVIHQEAITALAILTANSIELFHKVTELLLVKEGKRREVKDEAKTMAEITAVLTSEVNKIAAAYSDFLSIKLSNDSLSAEDKEKIESSITSIFLEASNSSTYIQDAFQLMVPILQCGAVA
ncbi:hypothetical protein J437_LFUL016187 [Ladona fulva]|uniref:Protein FAM114A2 n=1 Tax=Ladona fulva TaxID=123851 RepID=A0A8K0KNR1_LADFU|nr:hypothetical protein J437_LFUL016187 [Ladona fulva]